LFIDVALPATRIPRWSGAAGTRLLLLPLTMIVYAWELDSGMPTTEVDLLWLLFAVVVDPGGLGGGAHRQSRRW